MIPIGRLGPITDLLGAGEPPPPAVKERTIYDLLRALVESASTEPGFVNGFMTSDNRLCWYDVIDKAEQLNVFGNTARHLGGYE